MLFLDGGQNDTAKTFLFLDDDFGVIKIIQTSFETTTSRLCFFHKSQVQLFSGFSIQTMLNAEVQK